MNTRRSGPPPSPACPPRCPPMRAEKLQAKAAKVGFDWPDVIGAMAKVEVLAEFQEVFADRDAPDGAGSPERLREELGDLFFALVNVARYLQFDVEASLRQTTDKFIRRFSHIEDVACSDGRRLTEITLAEMDEIWEEAKRGRRAEGWKGRRGAEVNG